MQTRLPCLLMRAGTSRGPFLLAADLPADTATRHAVLLAAMGSPHPMQIDGIGGGRTLTSKVAIASPGTDPGIDVDYLFAQVSVDRGIVDTSANCGNMLAGIAPFAITRGLVRAGRQTTRVRVRNLNTGALVDVVMNTPGGQIDDEGEVAIPGVPGTGAAISLRFRNIAGARTGALFPTGRRTELIAGIAVTVIDCATPVMLIQSASLGADATASPAAIEADTALMARIEAMRIEAGERMGLGDVRDRVLPKPVLLGRDEAGLLTARYLTPHSVHAALAVTGGIAIATAARLTGTVAAAIVPLSVTSAPSVEVRIAHPSGMLPVQVAVADESVHWAGVTRTARIILDGDLMIPRRVWAGHQRRAA